MSTSNDSTTSPYTAPAAPSVENRSGSVDPIILQRLLGMRGWIYFLGVLFSVSIGLTCLLSVFGFLGYSPTGGQLDASSTALVILSASSCIFPVIRLFRISRAISKLGRSSLLDDLDLVLACMQEFWKHIGMVASFVMASWLTRYLLFI